MGFVNGDVDSLVDIYLCYNGSAVLILNKDHLIAPVQRKGKLRGSLSVFWHNLEIFSEEWKFSVIGPPALHLNKPPPNQPSCAAVGEGQWGLAPGTLVRDIFVLVTVSAIHCT